MSQRADEFRSFEEARPDAVEVERKKKEIEAEFKTYLARGNSSTLPTNLPKKGTDAEIAMKSLLASLRDENKKKATYKVSMSNAQHQRSMAYEPGRVGAA